MTDWDAEGLTAGLDERSRQARIKLLDELESSGVPVDEMRRAVAEDRLVLLPVEHVLGGQPQHTRAEVAERAGVDPGMIVRIMAAVGLSVPDEDAAAYTEHDVELAKQLKTAVDTGMPQDTLVELARVLGLGMARFAEAVRTAVGRGFMRAGDTEYDVATRYAALATSLLPDTSVLLQYAFTSHLLEVIRSDVITADERERGEVTGRTVQAVGFADLVGFTSLGQHLESEELSAVGAGLGAIAGDVLVAPTKLIKTIGDAVMLVSPDVRALVATMLRLVDAAAGDEELPALRAGVALGPAVSRFGDYYGSAVNLASRITGRALPGSVLTTDAVHAELAGEQGLRWSKAGAHRLKGFDERQLLWRVRATEPAAGADPDIDRTEGRRGRRERRRAEAARTGDDAGDAGG